MFDARLHRLEGTVRSFLTWWVGELADFVPANLRERIIPSNKATVIETHQIKGAEIPAGNRVTLRIPDADVLAKSILLPQAVERNLKESIALQLSQQTPYSADQVYFDAIVTHRDPASKHVEVLLVAVPRETVAAAVRDAQQAELDIHQVTAVDERIDLTPHDLKAGSSARILNMALAAATLALLVVVFVLPLELQKSAGNELHGKLDDIKTTAKETIALSTELGRLNDGRAFLLARKNETPLSAEVLNEVTRLLPDDAWLTEYHHNASNVRIVGFSANAASLLEIFENAPDFMAAQFRSPITKSPDGEAERFDLSFSIGSGGGP